MHAAQKGQLAKPTSTDADKKRTTLLPQLKSSRNSVGRLPQWGMHAASVQGVTQAASAQRGFGVKPGSAHTRALPGSVKEAPSQLAGIVSGS